MTGPRPSLTDRVSTPGFAAVLAAVALVAFVIVAARTPPAEDTPAVSGGATTPEALHTRLEVLGRIPQPPDAFVEGLAVLEDGHLLESTGAADQVSHLRRIDPATGRVEAAVDVDGVFAEGIAVVSTPGHPTAVWMLTWTDRVVIEFDAATLTQRRRISLSGADQGWGLCWDGRRVLSSDGSARLTVRDPDTFAPRGTIPVTSAGHPLDRLNALDCSPTRIWANLWPTDRLIGLDPTTGRTVAEVDLTALHHTEHPDPDPDAVPNGIAAIGDGTYWVTGKRWPHLLHVRLQPTAPAPSTQDTTTTGPPR